MPKAKPTKKKTTTAKKKTTTAKKKTVHKYKHGHDSTGRKWTTTTSNSKKNPF